MVPMHWSVTLGVGNLMERFFFYNAMFWWTLPNGAIIRSPLINPNVFGKVFFALVLPCCMLVLLFCQVVRRCTRLMCFYS